MGDWPYAHTRGKNTMPIVENNSKTRTDVTVSILMMTYNHHEYIGKAIDGALEQKTDFPYRLIIHDDASPDGTGDIIREYADHHPDVIVPLIERENQYSQGKIGGFDLLTLLKDSTYLAICEGDDFWCDPDKLQKQVDYMNAHPECSYCFSNAYDVDSHGTVIRERINAASSRTFTPEEIIQGFDDFPATASVLVRTRDFLTVPMELMTAGQVGDEPLRNYLMTKGNAYCFADKTCCYRVLTPGSWTSRFKEDLTFSLSQDKAICDYYKRFDAYSEGRFHAILVGKYKKHDCVSCLRSLDLRKLKTLYKEFYRKCSFIVRLIITIKYYCPPINMAIRYVHYGREKGMKGYHAQHNFFKDLGHPMQVDPWLLS